MSRLRNRIGQAIFALAAGPDGPRHRERIHGRPGPRWFDPDSPIGRVHGDASMFVGGVRAILLQTLHPAAMTAVAEHSDYRHDLLGRLARTSRFLAVTTFGHEEDAQQAVDVVRAIHDRIAGTMPDGTPYAASDPHLLEWVHVVEVESFLLAHQVYGRRPLDAAGCDRYVEQTAAVARRLGVTDPPVTVAELAERIEAFRPELRATGHAREAVHLVAVQPPLPPAARPPYRVLVASAVGLMPGWARAELRLPPPGLADRTVVRPLGGLATRGIRWAMAPPRRQLPDPAA